MKWRTSASTVKTARTRAVCKKLDEAFALGVKEGNSSNFVSNGIEVMKSMYLGKNGHIAIRTNSVPLAVAELEKKGFVCDMETAKYKGERMIAVYLKDEFGGFAVHLPEVRRAIMKSSDIWRNYAPAESAGT